MQRQYSSHVTGSSNFKTFGLQTDVNTELMHASHCTKAVVIFELQLFLFCWETFQLWYGNWFIIEGRNALKFKFDCHLLDGCLLDNHATHLLFWYYRCSFRPYLDVCNCVTWNSVPREITSTYNIVPYEKVRRIKHIDDHKILPSWFFSKKYIIYKEGPFYTGHFLADIL